MFCHKCGSNIPNDSAFCQKCGTRLIANGATQQSQVDVETTIYQQPNTPTYQQISSIPTPSSERTSRVVNDGRRRHQKKKNSKKLFLGIAGIIVVVVLAVVIILSLGNHGEELDLFQIALRVSPMTEYGFEATYGDLFSWLMTNRRTNLDQQGDFAYLTFLGTVTGGDYPVSIVLKMTGLSPNASNQRLEPYAMTLNEMDVYAMSLDQTTVIDFNNPEGILMDLFWAHHNKDEYNTFMDFVRWDNEWAAGTFRAFIDDPQLSVIQQETPTHEPEQPSEPEPSTPETDTSTDVSVQTFIRLEGWVRIDLPITWQISDDWIEEGYTYSEIYSDDYSIRMHLGFIAGGLDWRFEESIGQEQFIFNDGSIGYMFIYDYSVEWVHEGLGVNISLFDYEDLSVLYDNEMIINTIVKSLTFA